MDRKRKGKTRCEVPARGGGGEARPPSSSCLARPLSLDSFSPSFARSAPRLSFRTRYAAPFTRSHRSPHAENERQTLTGHRSPPEERPDVGSAARRVERCARRQGSCGERRRSDRAIVVVHSCDCSACEHARGRKHAVERAAPVDAPQRRGGRGEGLFRGGVC